MTTDRLAARTVTGVMAVMVAATAAATAVGFWLSYNGLHEFAIRAGMSGAEAWAWPASVDLFIVAGEAGVTISALRRERDWGAWAYLALGFAASVTGNILHVHVGQLPWAPYAVAAVPPMAAMCALAALLRIVYRLAIDRAVVADNVAAVSAREVAMARSGERAYAAMLSAAARAAEADRKRAEADRRQQEKADKQSAPKRPKAPTARARATRVSAKQDALRALVEQPDMSAEDLAERFGVSGRSGRRYRKEAAAMATAGANGHGGQA